MYRKILAVLILCSIFIAFFFSATLGQNPQAPFCFPTQGTLGYRYLEKDHRGIDIWTGVGWNPQGRYVGNDVAPPGNPIFLPYPGILRAVIPNEAGTTIQGLIFRHQIDSSYSGIVPELEIYTLYLHMANQETGESYVNSELTDKIGQSFPANYFLGYQGNQRWDAKSKKEDVRTHLHFGIYYVKDSPPPYLRSKYWRDPSPYIGYQLNVKEPNPLQKGFVFSEVCTLPTYWAKTYGGTYNGGAKSIQQTSDGGYIVGGGAVNSSLPRELQEAMWVIKLNPAGNIQWQKAYGQGETVWADSIQQTMDDGYIVAGVCGGVGAQDICVMKLDASGNIQWQKAYEDKRTGSIKQTSDGGYILAGVGIFDIAGISGGHMWISKLDADGNIQWQKAYATGQLSDNANSIQETPDGGYIVTGMALGSTATWVIKLDASGNIQWQKAYGTDNYGGSSIQQTMDGGYIVAGAGILVLKLDAGGNIQWQKTYRGGSGIYRSFIQQATDGGYIVAGTIDYSAGPSGDRDIWVLKLDASGNIQWQKTYGGTLTEGAMSIQQTLDGGYALAGSTHSFGIGNGDMIVLKLDSNGNISDCPIANTSNATVTNITVTVSDTNATVLLTTVSPVITDQTVLDTNVTPNLVCGEP